MGFILVSKFTGMPNWPLQPFRQDYGLAFHISHVVCVNIIRERRDLQNCKTLSTLSGRFLRNFFMAGLFTLRVFVRNRLQGNF